MTRHEIGITPEPSPEEREAVLKAVRAVLEREQTLARPAAWRLAGWGHSRCGVADFGKWMDDTRRWALSPRLPAGGRVFPGLWGRGDAR